MTPREPGEPELYEGTKEQRQEQERREAWQREQEERARDRYWNGGPS